MPETFNKVAVIGSGIMGSGIAQVIAASTRATVMLCDLERPRLDAALERIEHGRFGLRRSAERGKITEDDVPEIMGRLVPHTDLASACADVELVVEAIPEDLRLKCRLFRQLDEICPPDAVLASNTSGLPITALAWATRRPQRVLGWHWAQPTPVIKLAEIVVHPDLDQAVRDAVAAFAAACGKNPEVVVDQPQAWGFVANRVYRAAQLEASRVVEEGVATAEQVDRILKDSYRWPMGPLEMLKQENLR
jgi:3-hydroxybutyryl-CoA dehydrogenase